MPKTGSSLAKRIADLEVSNPKDFDPEEDAKYDSESGSEDKDSADENAGTEHYEKVGKSKLRKPIEIALGPKYTGSKVSRETAFADDTSTSDEEVESEDDGEGPFAELDEVDIETGVGMDDDDVDIDSDAAFGESDDEKFEKFMFRGSGRPRDAGVKGKGSRPTASDFMSDSEEEDEDLGNEESEQDDTDEDILDTSAQHSDEDVEMDSDGGASINNDEEDDEDDEDEEDSNESQSDQGSDTSLKDDDSEDDSEDENDKACRDELRALMGSEQQTVAAMSLAAKADALKGNAVRSQRKAFDQLLHTRMDLQKALIATNSLSAVDQAPIDEEIYSAAETAAIKLWSSLDSLRSSLTKPSKSSSKRKHSSVSTSTPNQDLWDKMQSHEITMLDNRQQILDKWSSKVRGTDSQPITRKLGQSSTSQPLSSLLRDQLSSSDHLIQKSRIPRSCAPLQRTANIPSSTEIYDDGPFYQLLLKELVDQRRVETLSNGGGGGEVLGWTAVKEVKQRKQVDTKASKGRKMRYNVHEKLQNYMAPEDRGSWEEEAVGRFFGTLLGQKMSLIEEDGDVVDEADGEVEAEEEGLRLFRS